MCVASQGGGIPMASKTLEDISETAKRFRDAIVVRWKVCMLLCVQYKPQELDPAVCPILIKLVETVLVADVTIWAIEAQGLKRCNTKCHAVQ